MLRAAALLLLLVWIDSAAHACEDHPVRHDYREANCALMSDRGGEPAFEPLAQCIAFMTRQRTLELRLLSYPSVSP